MRPGMKRTIGLGWLAVTCGYCAGLACAVGLMGDDVPGNLRLMGRVALSMILFLFVIWGWISE